LGLRFDLDAELDYHGGAWGERPTAPTSTWIVPVPPRPGSLMLPAPPGVTVVSVDCVVFVGVASLTISDVMPDVPALLAVIRYRMHVPAAPRAPPFRRRYRRFRHTARCRAPAPSGA